jgi:hypothetical protein
MSREGHAAARLSHLTQECRRWVKGGCGQQADGTAGLPPAPEMPGAFRHLRFVPISEIDVSFDNIVGAGQRPPELSRSGNPTTWSP